MAPLFRIAATVLLTLSPLFAGAQERLETATFAGGCFWCVEADFDTVRGVVETLSGYTGGSVEDPTYEEVSAGGTGHYEAVRIRYDPAEVTYDQLLTAYWHSVDPTDPGGQFCDRGNSYRTAIFAHGPGQRRAAEASKEKAERQLGRKIVTPILDAGVFHVAEEHHQNYYRKNSLSYRFYRWSCGRDARVGELWGERAYKGIPGHG